MLFSSCVQADHLSAALACPTNKKGVESGRHTCNQLDRFREPPPGAYSPEPQGVGKDDPDCDGRVVERL